MVIVFDEEETGKEAEVQIKELAVSAQNSVLYCSASLCKSFSPSKKTKEDGRHAIERGA